MDKNKNSRGGKPKLTKSQMLLQAQGKDLKGGQSFTGEKKKRPKKFNLGGEAATSVGKATVERSQRKTRRQKVDEMLKRLYGPKIKPKPKPKNPNRIKPKPKPKKPIDPKGRKPYGAISKDRKKVMLYNTKSKHPREVPLNKFAEAALTALDDRPKKHYSKKTYILNKMSKKKQMYYLKNRNFQKIQIL